MFKSIINWIWPVSSKPVKEDKTWPGFWHRGMKRYFKPVHSNVPGRRPKDLRKDELSYHEAEDIFFVGTGNNKFVEYHRR